MTIWYTPAYEHEGRIVPADINYCTVRLDDAEELVATEQRYWSDREIFVAFAEKPEWQRLND